MDTESNPASSPEPEAPQSSRSTGVIHPALDIGRKAAFVGIVDHSKKPWVIGYEPTPRATRYDANKLYQSGCLVPSPYAYESLRGRWPSSDLEDFLARPAAPMPDEIVPRVREALLSYVEFERPEHATLCACWIVGTYVHQVFAAFPRLNLHGERGSGKSKLLQIIAELSFNGLLCINPTPAVLFRLIGPLRPTLCLDEMEGLDGSDDKAIYSILNAGYKAGATVARIEGDASNRRPVGFEVYGPVAFGGITGLNTTTADRSITIHMVRGRDMATINRIVNPHDSDFAAIRASLYRFALALGSWMRSQPLSDLVPPFVTGRPRELFLPLLVIAELAGGSPWREDLFHVYRRTLNERESLPDEGRALFYVLQVRLANLDSLTLCPGDLVDEISRELGMQLDRGERISSKKVGNLLARYGFERASKTNRGNPYRITRADFREKAQRNGYPFSGDFAEIKPKPPTGSGFPQLENLDA